MQIQPRKLLNKLVEKKLITQDKASLYEVESLKKNQSIEEYLLDNTKIDSNTIFSTIAELINVKYIDVKNTAIDPQAINLIPSSIASRYQILPISYDPKNNVLNIATADPFNLTLLDFLEKKTNKKISYLFAYQKDISKMIDSVYNQSLSPEVKEALQEINKDQVHISKEKTNLVVKEAPIAKIVNTVLEFAIRSRASDIHIEPLENKTRVRYRIDGVLHEKLSLPKGIHEAIVSRIKILSGLKIDEKRIPQDGRFSFNLEEEEIDLRVSTLPSVHGEKIVMRLLKKTGGIPSLTELGLSGPQLRDLEEAIARPYGIILVTGPTGSGKTTTLYSVLSRLNKPSVNIVTLEDPVEYQIPGINQVQINPQAGLTFATGLRAFLRQDPNIILVGEIRDRETTQLAIQAALTGHLVFSTLHTNDAATAIPRLVDLGAETFLIASVLNAVIAQRIVRRICPYCKTTFEPDKEVIDNIKQVLGEFFPKKYQIGQPILLTKGQGCSECNQTGYLGRIGIFELLKVTSNINKMIIKEASGKEIETEAKKQGLITMKQDGYLKVLEGITTIEEVLRVAEDSN